MTRKLLNIAGMIGLATVAFVLRAQPGGIRLLGTQAGRPARVVKGAPYSAEVSSESTRILADGNTIRQSSSARIYRDSEGRTRQDPALQPLRSAAGGKVPQLAFIYDPVASVSYVLDLMNRTATRTVWPPVLAENTNQPSRRLSRRDEANTKRETLGSQIFGGLLANVTRDTLMIPTGQIGNTQPITVVTERWYSPDLQIVLYSKRTDPREGDTIYQLANINRSEPPAALFLVPPDFPISDAKPRLRRQGP